MKVFAFLDVDDTLLYNNNTINWDLLKQLKERKIFDIYLFTNMSMKELAYLYQEDRPMTRYELVKLLEKEGLSVHGVISSTDTGYYETDESDNTYPISEAYNTLYKPLYEKIIKDKKPISDPTTDINNRVDFHWHSFLWDKANYIARCRKEIGIEKGLEAWQYFELPQLAVIYLDFEEDDDEEIKRQRERKRVVCSSKDELKQVLSPLIAAGREDFEIIVHWDNEKSAEQILSASYPDNKATMMALAIDELTQKYDDDLGIFYADDNAEHLDGATIAVRDFNDSKKSRHHVYLTTHKMPRTSHLAESEEAIIDCKNALESFVDSTSYSYQLVNERIDAEIKHLKEMRDGYLYSFNPSLKIAALNTLKTRIEMATQGESFQQVIDNWAHELAYRDGFGNVVTRKEMMGSHRNFFSYLFSFVSAEETQSTRFIKALTAEFGQLTIYLPQNKKEVATNEQELIDLSI